MKLFAQGRLGRPLLLAAWSMALVVPAVSAVGLEQRCQSKIHDLTGDYLNCRLDVEASAVKGQKAARSESRQTACRRLFERNLATASQRWGDACPDLAAASAPARRTAGVEAEIVTADSSAGGRQTLLHAAVDETVERMKLLTSGTPPAAQAGKLVLVNNCAVPLKLMAPANPQIDGNQLNANGGTVTYDLSQLGQNSNNTILVAPVTTTGQCTQVACEKWTAIQPNSVQRKGSMWEAPNQVWAAYCQPTNAAAAQCAPNAAASPCCGPNMNYDKTFGTTVEITPGTPTGNDFINLSTNYGTDANTPPKLCGPGVDDQDCVTVAANIFYNLPVQVLMAGPKACSCGSLGDRTALACTAPSCTDAYRHPTDPKQCSCSSGGTRGYVVIYCPAGSPLPAFPG